MNDSDPAGTDSTERWRADRTTFQRVYDVVAGTRESLSAKEFGDLAHCSTNGARRALDQLVEMGVADRRETRPVTYRRNDSYFTWRRIESLAREHTAEDLRQRLAELVEEDREFQERYGVPTPDAVPADHSVVEDHETLHERWEDLNEWRTVRRDVPVLQRAIQRAESGSSGHVEV